MPEKISGNVESINEDCVYNRYAVFQGGCFSHNEKGGLPDGARGLRSRCCVPMFLPAFAVAVLPAGCLLGCLFFVKLSTSNNNIYLLIKFSVYLLLLYSVNKLITHFSAWFNGKNLLTLIVDNSVHNFLTVCRFCQ